MVRGPGFGDGGNHGRQCVCVKCVCAFDFVFGARHRSHPCTLHATRNHTSMMNEHGPSVLGERMRKDNAHDCPLFPLCGTSTPHRSCLAALGWPGTTGLRNKSSPLLLAPWFARTRTARVCCPSLARPACGVYGLRRRGSAQAGSRVPQPVLVPEPLVVHVDLVWGSGHVGRAGAAFAPRAPLFVFVEAEGPRH